MNPKNSVLHVINSLDINEGGPSRSVPNQCWSTVQAGLNVGITYLHKNEKLSAEANLLGQHKVEVLPIDSLIHLGNLWRHIARYDIVHVNGIWSPFCHFGAYFARLQKKPLIVTIHGMLEPWALNAKKIKKRIGYKIYQERDLQNASVLQATSLDEIEHLRGLGLKTSIALIPNGVEIPTFKNKKSFSSSNRRILFLSRVHPKKGVLELIRAVATLHEEFVSKHWRVTIAGPNEGGHLKEVKKEASKLGVEDLVEYMGAVEGSEKWALYRSADVFVLPTYSENFGLVIAEALGCGIPVVTTYGAPWKELTTHHCGWWHPVGQKELERTLGKVLTTTPTRLKEMGERGRRLVHQEYEWPKIGIKLKETYGWLLDQRLKPEWVRE